MNRIVVLDVRSIQFAPHSGVARFTQCLAQGLAEVARTQHHIQLVLAGTHEFSGIDSPSVSKGSLKSFLEQSSAPVSFVGFGSTRSWWVRKPRFLWSTVVFAWFAKRVRILSGRSETIVWLAPDNIDRPLRFFGDQFPKRSDGSAKKIAHIAHIVQVIHDLIALRYPTRGNRFLRLQLRFLLGSVLRRGVSFAPISELTRAELTAIVPAEYVTKGQIPNRIGVGVAADLRKVNTFDKSSLVLELESQIIGLREVFGKYQLLEPSGGSSGKVRFVLGVGRDERYKSWSEVTDVLSQLAPVFDHNLWFLHVCTSSAANAYYEQLSSAHEESSVFGACTIYPRIRLIRVTDVSDLGLACLYRYADALIHLSKAEGYGLPLAEAYLAGLAVFAVQRNGFAEVFRRLPDQSAVHFFDSSPDYELLAGALFPEAALEDRLNARLECSKKRLADRVVENLLLSNATMGMLANQIIDEVTATQ
jgi:glycosyltransferase involved in cell wall biosynthesis